MVIFEESKMYFFQKKKILGFDLKIHRCIKLKKIQNRNSVLNQLLIFQQNIVKM